MKDKQSSAESPPPDVTPPGETQAAMAAQVVAETTQLLAELQEITTKQLPKKLEKDNEILSKCRHRSCTARTPDERGC